MGTHLPTHTSTHTVATRNGAPEEHRIGEEKKTHIPLPSFRKNTTSNAYCVLLPLLLPSHPGNQKTSTRNASDAVLLRRNRDLRAPRAGCISYELGELREEKKGRRGKREEESWKQERRYMCGCVCSGPPTTSDLLCHTRLAI